MKRGNGFTLVEILIFVALFAIVVEGTITIFLVITRIKSTQTSAVDVQTQAAFLTQEIQNYIQAARLADMPLDSPQGTLSLGEGALTSGPTSIYASPSYVQSAEGISYNITTVSATFTGNVTSGDALAVGVMWENSSTAITGITDNCGKSGGSDAYTILGSPVTGQYNDVQMAYALAGASGPCTVTATLGAASLTSGRLEIFVDEITGVNSMNPVDGNQYALNFQSNPSGTDGITSGPVTIGNAGDYLWGITFNEGEDTGIPISPGTGYTLGGSGALTESEYAISPSSGGATSTFTRGWSFGSFITGIIPFRAGGSQSGRGIVYVEQGGGAEEALTTNSVIVSNLSFTRHYNIGSSTPYGADSVSFSFTMAENTTNATKEYSATFSSAAAVAVPVGKIALIQQASAGGHALSSLSFVGPNETSDLLIAVASVLNNPSATISISDTAGNTWHMVANPMYPSYGEQIGVFAAYNSAASTDTVSVSYSTTTLNSANWLAIYEYRGASTSTSFDAYSTALAPNTTTPSSGQAYPTSAVELAMGIAFSSPLFPPVPSAGSGFAVETTSSYAEVCVEDENVYVTGGVSAGWTMPSAVSSSASVVTFH